MALIPVGRERELKMAAELIARRNGACSALIFEGRPGVGKTTVLNAAVADALSSGCRVLSCRPAESEASLPFVALGDLLEPALEAGLDQLPPAQRNALEAALARGDPTVTFGRLAVSRATLAMLRDLAGESPVVIAIDDAQWLDRCTAEVLAFAMRRLGEAPVHVLLTQRSGGDADLIALSQDVPRTRLTVGPLALAHLGRLISEHFEITLTRPRLRELHGTTGGNPYFALEILRALAGREAPLAPGEPLPVPHDIAVLLRSRISSLSDPARDALLLIAASPQPTAALVTGAAGAAEGLRDAVAAAIVEQDGDRLRFSHPLLASVVYGEAGAPAQRDAHLRLAAAAPDQDERAVHLARATLAPDAAVSKELDASARRVYRCGAPAAAAELQERAWRLTPVDLRDVRLERMLRSAEYYLAAGDTAHGRGLLEDLLAAQPSGTMRARIAMELGKVRYVSDDVAAARILFEDALHNAGEDRAIHADAQQALAFTAMLGGDVSTALGHACSSLALAERLDDPRILALASCRVALNEFLAGQGVNQALFERAISLEDERLEATPVEALPSYAYAWCRLMSDDLAGARVLYDELARTAEERADERYTAGVLFAMSELETRAGNWARASQLAMHAVERSTQAGLGTVRVWSLYTQALVAAHLGDVAAARHAASEGMRIAQRSSAVAPLTQITSVLGFLELSLGDSAGAHRHLGPLAELIASVGIAEPGVVRFMPNAIEALIALGDLDAASQLLDVLDGRARVLDRVSARAASARCRALLAAADGDLDRARASLDEAFVQHARCDEPFELGRTLVAQGSIERRARQRATAREALTRALELFDTLGAALWSERAAGELARIPGRAAASDQLSATERQVAELAARALSNKEIAARMFVTVRTVEAHLSKVYAKLGVRSRVELAARVNSDGAPVGKA